MYIFYLVLFIGAIICGAGVGLGLSFPLISSVISEIFNIDRTVTLDLMTIIICSLIFGTSAYIGVQKGIKRLSNINMILVISFLVIIFMIGPTWYILSNSIETLSFFFIKTNISSSTPLLYIYIENENNN